MMLSENMMRQSVMAEFLLHCKTEVKCVCVHPDKLDSGTLFHFSLLLSCVYISSNISAVPKYPETYFWSCTLSSCYLTFSPSLSLPPSSMACSCAPRLPCPCLHALTNGYRVPQHTLECPSAATHTQTRAHVHKWLLSATFFFFGRAIGGLFPPAVKHARCVLNNADI